MKRYRLHIHLLSWIINLIFMLRIPGYCYLDDSSALALKIQLCDCGVCTSHSITQSGWTEHCCRFLLLREITQRLTLVDMVTALSDPLCPALLHTHSDETKGVCTQGLITSKYTLSLFICHPETRLTAMSLWWNTFWCYTVMRPD